MIKAGSVVSLAYSLTNKEGEELDRADSTQPLSYLHGSGQIIPGLENALTGLTVGARKKVVVPPSEGYGEIDENLKTTASVSDFPVDQVSAGMRFAAEVGPGQQIVFTVVNVEGDVVYLDGNDALAGETLHFDVEVVGVREATPEELAHGHAHGAHGDEAH